MKGRPSVRFTPRPKLAYLSTGSPWSWYMASTASAARSVDHALLHRSGHHRRELSRQAAANRAVEDREHIARVRRVEPPGDRGPRERHVLHVLRAGQERAVADEYYIGL